MEAQGVLDLERRELVAARLEDVGRGAAEDPEDAALADGHVAGEEPAVGEGPRGLLRPAVVLAKERRAPHAQLARLLRRRTRRPPRRRASPRRPAAGAPTVPGTRSPRSGFESAIPISVMPYRSRRRCPESSSHREKSGTGSAAEPETMRRSARHAALRRARVAASACLPRRGELRVDRRDRHEERQAALLDPPPARLRVESREHLDARPVRERAESVTFTRPCVWWSGRTFGIASSALHSHASESDATWAARLPCVWTAPFGFPVVPLV